MRSSSLGSLALPLCLALHAGCEAVVGIEDAHVDPRLSGAASGGVRTGSGGSSAGQSPTGGTSPTGGQSAGGSAGDSPAGGSSDGGSDAAAGAAGASDAGSAGAASQDLCDTYCTQIQAYCSGALEQYRDLAQCEKVCRFFPTGEIGGSDGNSVACRLKYAGNARYAAGTELEAYCRQAGPGGDNRCGTNCDGYCTVMTQVCTRATAPIYYFGDEAECLEQCSELPTSDVTYSTSDPLVSDGNHVQCRLFHATSAAMLDPEEHCEHAVGLTLCAAE
jgi:hypothetical protein